MGLTPDKATTLYNAYAVAKRDSGRAGTPLVRVRNTYGGGGIIDTGVDELHPLLKFAADYVIGVPGNINTGKYPVPADDIWLEYYERVGIKRDSGSAACHAVASMEMSFNLLERMDDMTRNFEIYTCTTIIEPRKRQTLGWEH
jgi:hypothetical protein